MQNFGVYEELKYTEMCSTLEPSGMLGRVVSLEYNDI
jgi:hypothetical protein